MSKKTHRLLKLYEEHLHVRFGNRTVPEYVAHVRRLMGWLQDRGLELTDVRTEDLLAYQSYLLSLRKPDGRPYSAGHQANQLKGIKALFGFLYRRGYLLHDPAAGVDYPRLEKRLPRTILTPKEVRKMLEAPEKNTAQGLRDRAILETFYATGIRATELSNLTPYDVDTEERVLRVVMGKGRKDRHVPLTRAAASAIELYLLKARPKLMSQKKTRFLFVSDHGGWMHRAILARLIRHYAHQARIHKRVTCHSFRHTVATHLLQGRADIRHIQALLGHGSLGTTERYTRVELSDLKEVIRRAHPRGR